MLRNIFLLIIVVVGVAVLDAQSVPAGSYVIGPQDILSIAVYDQADLGGKYTVETDGTFSFPLIGRVRAGGLTLRELELELKKQLADGFFRNPQVTVAVEQYRSQRIFIVGEVRQPGTYPLTGDMTLIEALSKAGSTLPSASGEAVIVRPKNPKIASGPTLPTGDDDKWDVTTVVLRELESGALSKNLALRDGDTIFVPRAESVYVFGEVKNPGSYAVQKETSVLQALSLAGGVTENGAMNRIRIVRLDGGQKKDLKVKLSDTVKPGDTIVVPQRLF